MAPSYHTMTSELTRRDEINPSLHETHKLSKLLSFAFNIVPSQHFVTILFALLLFLWSLKLILRFKSSSSSTKLVLVYKFWVDSIHEKLRRTIYVRETSQLQEVNLTTTNNYPSEVFCHLNSYRLLNFVGPTFTKKCFQTAIISFKLRTGVQCKHARLP